jgi:hypothetical protein
MSSYGSIGGRANWWDDRRSDSLRGGGSRSGKFDGVLRLPSFVSGQAGAWGCLTGRSSRSGSSGRYGFGCRVCSRSGRRDMLFWSLCAGWYKATWRAGRRRESRLCRLLRHAREHCVVCVSEESTSRLLYNWEGTKAKTSKAGCTRSASAKTDDEMPSHLDT